MGLLNSSKTIRGLQDVMTAQQAAKKASDIMIGAKKGTKYNVSFMPNHVKRGAAGERYNQYSTAKTIDDLMGDDSKITLADLRYDLMKGIVTVTQVK